MTLSIAQSAYAVTIGAPASFMAVGATGAVTFSVVPGGAGGAIGSSTGTYVTPSSLSEDPRQAYDTIQVVDSTLATATTTILVGTPLTLFCEIIQRELSLANGRVYLWDQKILQPRDSSLYVAVSVPVCRPFANSNHYGSTIGGMDSNAFVSMFARLDLDIISRGPAARDRKEEVILALNSQYSQQQQSANSFYISQLSSNFINLSQLDGAAIPYRYRISVNMQYAYAKIKPAQYFDDYPDLEVVTEYTPE